MTLVESEQNSIDLTQLSLLSQKLFIYAYLSIDHKKNNTKAEDISDYQFNIIKLASILNITEDIYENIQAAMQELRAVTIISSERISGLINAGEIYKTNLILTFDNRILNNITKIHCSTSAALFKLFLKHSIDLSEINIDISLNDLKSIFNMPMDKYKNYGDFKKRILIPSIKELTSETFVINFNEIKKDKSKKVIGLKFTAKIG